MRTITIAARKGGAGKSTLAAHLSVLAGPSTLLVDVDPQGSLGYWWRLRKDGLPRLIECTADKLRKIVELARADGYGWCIVDTPPHAEASILEAMRSADLVLVPTRPGPFDLAAVRATLDLARKGGRRTRVVVNHAPPQQGWGEPALVREAREAIAGMGGMALASVVSQRIALSHAIISGMTVGEWSPASHAAREVSALWNELERQS